MVKTLILITGKARSGKDTTKDILTTLLEKDNEVEAMSFAEPLKDIVAETFGIRPSQLEEFKNDDKLTKIHVDRQCINKITTDFRQILQRFGTEAMKKHFGEYVWTDMLIKKYRKSNSDVIIVSDWRFKEEYYRIVDKLKDVNLITVQVQRDGLVSTSTHQSEVDLEDNVDFDYIIKNSGVNKADLVKQLSALIEESL